MNAAQTGGSEPDRYESFVVRVWIAGAAGFKHGEIRHIPSRARLRFVDWNQALEFIARFSDPGTTTRPGEQTDSSAQAQS